jgi:hypothetical protein
MCKKMNEKLITKNVVDLTLKFSGVLVEWLFAMTQLRQISLGNQIDMSPNDFMRLLKNTPHLDSVIASYHTLKLLTNQWKSKIVCEQLSRQIRSLKIYSNECFSMNCRDYVKVDELLPIVRVFGQRCQHLTVAVYSRNVVAGLILRNMRHLRGLKVHLKEHGDLKITKAWLEEQDIIFKHLDCSIVMDGNEYLFWFGHRR